MSGGRGDAFAYQGAGAPGAGDADTGAATCAAGAAAVGAGEFTTAGIGGAIIVAPVLLAAAATSPRVTGTTGGATGDGETTATVDGSKYLRGSALYAIVELVMSL